MFKIVLRTLIILLVTGLVAGGIYLFAENAGTSLLGNLPEGEHGGRGAAFAGGERPAHVEGGNISRGDFAREGGGPEGGMGFSLMGLFAQAVKIAVITAVVLLIQALVRLVRRRRHPAHAVAG